jgi:hypothetical protein
MPNTNWRPAATSKFKGIEYKRMSIEENEAELRALYGDIENLTPASVASALENRVCNPLIVFVYP